MTSSVIGQRPSTKLRELVNKGEPIIVPGALEPLTAMLLETMGFECICLGGTFVALQLRLVEPLLMLPDVVDASARITRVTDVPLIVDAEHGFGDLIQVERMVHDYEAARVAGAHLEDSRVPRRMRGSPMVPMEEMVRKIRVAQAARTDPDFFLICRTEAAGAAVGGGLDEARRRLHAYVDAGADALMPMVFDRDDAAKIGEEFKGIPLVYIAGSRRDKLPELSAPDAIAMGYQIIFYAGLGITAALHAYRTTFQNILETGSSGVDHQVHTDASAMYESFIRSAHALELEKQDLEGS